MLWREWAAWQGRPLELGSLGHGESGPYIQTTIASNSVLARAWRRLPRIPLMLEALHGGDALRLRYAALCGTYAPTPAGDAEAVPLAFDLAAQLAALIAAVPLADRAPFTAPHAYVDFNGHARIAFAEPSADADLREVGFVRAFGRMLDEILDFSKAPPKHPIVLLRDAARRGTILDLKAVRADVRALDPYVKAIDPAAWDAWCELESAVGYDVLGNRTLASAAARTHTYA